MDGQKDWNDAIDWCNNLTHGGYSDWRLPNVRELFSLIDISKFSPALPEGHPFTNVTWNRYWSSTTHAINAGSAWIFRVAWTGWSWVESKSNNYIVWPVRGHSTGTIKVHKTGQTISYRDGDDGYYQMGVEWPNPRFTDHGNGTVTDELTGLMWTQNANMALNFPNEDYPPNAYGGLIWNNAIDYCNALHHGGHGDWRLHNVRELESLIDYSKNSPAMLEGHPFADVKNYYWSSTTCAINSSKAWGLDIRYGFMETGYKASSIYVWPVRDGH